MSAQPSDYQDIELANIEAARQQYLEGVSLGRNPRVPDFQEYVRDMQRTAERENECTKWSQGPVHEAEKVSNIWFKFSYCKPLITFSSL